MYNVIYHRKAHITERRGGSGGGGGGPLNPYTTFLILLLNNLLIMAEVSKEQMKLAIRAFNQGQFQSKTACAQAFDVPSQTLMKHLNEATSREESIANG